MAFDIIAFDAEPFGIDTAHDAFRYDDVETGGRLAVDADGVETDPLDPMPFDLEEPSLALPDAADIDAFIEASDALGEGLKTLETRLFDLARGALNATSLATDPAQDAFLHGLYQTAMVAFTTVQALNLSLLTQELLGDAAAAGSFQFLGAQPPEHELDLARARIAVAGQAANAAGPALALARAAQTVAWQGAGALAYPVHFLNEAFFDLFGLHTTAITRMADAAA